MKYPYREKLLLFAKLLELSKQWNRRDSFQDWAWSRPADVGERRMSLDCIVGRHGKQCTHKRCCCLCHGEHSPGREARSLRQIGF